MQPRLLGKLVMMAAYLLPAAAVQADDWLTRASTDAAHTATLKVPAGGVIYFLRFGDHSFEPDQITTLSGRPVQVEKREPIVLAAFQRLCAIPWQLRDVDADSSVHAIRSVKRDEFWDQIILVDPAKATEPPLQPLVEAGIFGSALPAHVKSIAQTPDQIQATNERLDDPVIPSKLDREMSWPELEGKALPLDFQKVLIGSFNDPNPAFAFQNGQWFTTWPSRDFPKGGREDHWFAPALIVNGEIMSPAPLSARSEFMKTKDGRTIPCWILEWDYGGARVREELFSLRTPADAEPQVFIRFDLSAAPSGAQLAIGVGRRPNVHYWDDKSRERTPIPFFTFGPKYRQAGQSLIDSSDHVIANFAEPFSLESLGSTEMLLVVESDSRGYVHIQTPQSGRDAAAQPFSAASYDRAMEAFRETWTDRLNEGAQVKLPSEEWMSRIDIWRSQLECITRVKYGGKERLSYGAYFYQYYFGIEEGWPVVALAQWGRGEEAKRQARIMLEPENLNKSNVHHQSRNGVGPAVAALVARLTNDSAFLESISAPLLECAKWTTTVSQKSGLLPPHIYGGDIRDPATSLYATAACWRGIVETADAFRHVGSKSLQANAAKLDANAIELRSHLDDAFKNAVDRKTSPPFVPLALELPSLNGKNEGPYDRLTATRLGNYWNLFAPSFLELHFGGVDDWVFEYEQTHGGLWAGLPRFYEGLDAAYAVGNISYLLNKSVSDITYRHQALASLQSFFLHAASRNGYTVPEVAGLFPYRFDQRAYENLVRESPWNFGMYSGERYLHGDISFTEPLGAGAGEALTMIRSALVTETRDNNGLPDGGLMLLSAVPGDWFAEGKDIVLKNFPTAYGTVSATVHSSIISEHKITVDYSFMPFTDNNSQPPTRPFVIRIAPPNQPPRDVPLERSGNIEVKF